MEAPNSLSTDKLKKENAIITSVSDIDHLNINEALRDRIKSALDNRESIDKIKPKINIPILLLHECGETLQTTDLTDQYRLKIAEFHKDRSEAYFLKQLSKSQSVHRYNDIKFHIILFPVPNKKMIVDAFVNYVSIYKEMN